MRQGSKPRGRGAGRRGCPGLPAKRVPARLRSLLSSRPGPVWVPAWVWETSSDAGCEQREYRGRSVTEPRPPYAPDAAEPLRARVQRRKPGARPARLRLPFLWILLAWAGCGSDERRWIDLSALSTERVRFDGSDTEVGLSIGELAGRALELHREGQETWLEVGLARADWKTSEPAGSWLADVPDVEPIWTPDEELSPTERLLGDGVAFPAAALDAEHGYRAESGVFLRIARCLQLRLSSDELPPERLRFGWRVTHGERTEERFRVSGPSLSGDGFAVAPGTGCTLALELPADGVLRFATCSEPAATDAQAGTNRFRVLLDGEPLFQHDQALLPDGSTSWHEVALPEGARAGELRLTVDGPFAYTSFLAPVIGPPRVDDYGSSARKRTRPNLVLFVADTLRADALSAYRSEPVLPGAELTPALDRLAREGRVFTQARSVSTWTLPSFASILTGSFPHQVNATQMDSALPGLATTLAERLQASGYRTAAVTEGGFVSRNHGFAQGFGWFREGDEDLDATLADAADALAADDGRPLFLFVHTFRAHAPYEVSAETRERLGEELGLEPADSYDSWIRAKSGPDVGPAAAAKLRALYLGGVADLDRGFGAFRSVLSGSGLLDNGYLLFTSDHGEAFGEHGEFLHTGPPFEMLVRVPLILFGKDVEPLADHGPASLVDVTPTLCALSGVEASGEGGGRSLLALEDGRPVFSFQCGNPDGPSSVALVEKNRKVMGLRPADLLGGREVHAAYDLEDDPQETKNLSQESPWAQSLLQENAEALRSALAPRLPGAEAVLDPTHRAELRALGYVDADEAPAGGAARAADGPELREE